MFTWYDLVYQWFNAVYTFLPILFVATFDQDVNANIVMKYPSLYKDGLERKFMTHASFWRWMVSHASRPLAAGRAASMATRPPLIILTIITRTPATSSSKESCTGLFVTSS